MRKIKVLIADDINRYVEMISFVVRKNENFEIVGIANNGGEALEKIEELNPDLVFTDNQMPYMRGTELIDKFENNELIKFVLVTSDRGALISNFCDLHSNVLGLINKPFFDEQIENILEEYVINFTS